MNDDNVLANPYDEGDLRHDAWELRNIPFGQQLLNTARKNGFKRDTIDALTILLNDIMSSNTMLSNQTPPAKTFRNLFDGSNSFNQLQYTKLSITGCIERFLCSVHPTDKKKDIVYQMIADIMNHTENFTLTRTVGDDREGVVNRIEHSKTTQELKQYDMEQKETEKKKRAGLF